MKEIDFLARSLSYETLETAVLYLDESGVSTTIEGAGELIAGHFETLLNSRLNSDFFRSEITFTKEKAAILSKFPGLNEPEKDDLYSGFISLFTAGYISGYVAGIKDMETLQLAFHEVERKTGGEHEQKGSGQDIKVY